MSTMTPAEFDEIKSKKIELMKQLLAIEPPKAQGDDIIDLWEKIYDDDVKNVVVETTVGPSDEATNPVFPYQKLRAIVGDGGNWKWPRMWQKLDEVERRGRAYREGEVTNFQGENKNPNIVPQRCLVIGGGPIGLRLAIELKMGGHDVTLFEKRREIRDSSGEMLALGFTNRINRPHMWHYVRNDLAKFNGKDFMSRQACYPVFTEPETSSIGIDELQVLLLKNVLLLGVDVRLGVGYENAKIRVDPKTSKPTWDVECTYDKHAAVYFGMQEGKNIQNFEVLVGADGSRSRVRDSQAKFFGNIEKRKFMDCVGIVANVQKLTRPRLKELGFPNGLEPSDMNRTKMAFGSFFDKLKTEAKADLENVIYYKASFHNYVILTPKRANLIEHGLSGKVYHFAAARGKEDGRAAAMAEEKVRMKEYVKGVLKVAGIPIDEALSNGGFVEAPNDCMAFDFAECWNTPKSINFSLPPPDYNVDEHGAWVGPPVAPFVGLVGDALLEPFWPLGLGLKRGWQAVMDTCWAVDNLYNRTLLCEELSRDPSTFSWDDHFEAMSERIKEHFQSCSKVDVADELGKGEYAADGLCMLQWKKNAGEREKPEFLVEIDPATRYKKRNQSLNSLQKRRALEDKNWLHPIVVKYMAIRDYEEIIKKEPQKNGWNKLVSINGKTVVQQKSGYTFKAPEAAAAAPKPFKLPTAEIETVSTKKRESLIRKVTETQIDDHVSATLERRRSVKSNAEAGLLAALQKRQGDALDEGDMHDMGHTVHGSDNIAERQEAMWDRMLEKNLSPAQKAELSHIRNMIESLQKSIEGYRQAEKAIIMGNK